MVEVKHRCGCIEVNGHAGYAEYGQDIVCAAISALTQVFVASVEELTEDNIKYDMGAGNAFIEYENLTERAQVLLDSFLLGISMIAEDYPDNVQLTEH